MDCGVATPLNTNRMIGTKTLRFTVGPQDITDLRIKSGRFYRLIGGPLHGVVKLETGCLWRVNQTYTKLLLTRAGGLTSCSHFSLPKRCMIGPSRNVIGTSSIS